MNNTIGEYAAMYTTHGAVPEVAKAWARLYESSYDAVVAAMDQDKDADAIHDAAHDISMAVATDFMSEDAARRLVGAAKAHAGGAAAVAAIAAHDDADDNG